MKILKTPVFIFNKKILEYNYNYFESLCKKYLKNFKIAYSIKTNSFKEVIKTLTQKGGGFEVASFREIRLIPKKKFVVFNSPCKTEQELKIAIKNNFLINIDSKSELDKISKILKGKPFKVGIRITTKNSKFGIQADKINEIINYAKSKNLKVICLHFHQGTQIGINYYEENLQKFSDLIRNLNIPLEYIDLGGGFPDKPGLKDLGLKLENYFEVIKKYFYDFDKTIILEPGRALVSDCFELLTCVKVIKENFGKNYAILDAGINLLPKITLSKYKFTKLQDGECKEVEKKKEYILAGPLLFSNDILGKFYGILKEGDIIKVENVGAYCYNLAWEISYKKPKIILF